MRAGCRALHSVEETGGASSRASCVPPPPRPVDCGPAVARHRRNGYGKQRQRCDQWQRRGALERERQRRGRRRDPRPRPVVPAAAAVAYREAVRETVIAATELQSRVAQLVNAYRVRGHLFAHLDPLGNAAARRARARALATSASARRTSTRCSPPPASAACRERATLREIVAHLTETYCSLDRRRVHAHRGARAARLAAAADGVDAQPRARSTARELAAHPHEAHRRRDLRAVHPQELRRRQALLARGRREHDPDDRSARRGGRARTASRRSSSAWPTAGASTCSSTSWARTCARSSPRSTTRSPSASSAAAT